MYNDVYEQYIRNILGYNTNDNQMNNYNQTIENNSYNVAQLENCYPDIYKVVYPMILKRCNEIHTELNSDEISKITDEIYNLVETNEEIAEKRQNNNVLRDLIRILLIRELLRRPGRPGGPIMPGRPNYYNRPPMRPPFMRKYDFDSEFDIFEN